MLCVLHSAIFYAECAPCKHIQFLAKDINVENYSILKKPGSNFLNVLYREDRWKWSILREGNHLQIIFSYPFWNAVASTITTLLHMTLVKCLFTPSCLKKVICMLFVEDSEDDWILGDGERLILNSTTDIWQLKQGYSFQ